MRNDHYPPGTVQALLSTDLVSESTRYVLQQRLEKIPVATPLFFDADTFITLRAVCMRLIPQPEEQRMVDLAGWLDSALAKGKGNGWRYDTMPEDGKAFTMGLNGIKETSVRMFGRHFHLLATKEQDEVLSLVQKGTLSDPVWQLIPASLFFEELLAALVEQYYSHPFAKEAIGEVAMADAKGWKKIGLNEHEAHEPEAIR